VSKAALTDAGVDGGVTGYLITGRLGAGDDGPARDGQATR
jgi:hypothetical protein